MFLLKKNLFSWFFNKKKAEYRIAVVGNLCNSGWMIQKSLGAVGLDSDLFISQSELDTPSDPRWNDPDVFSRGNCYFWNLTKEPCGFASKFSRSILFKMSRNKFLNAIRLCVFLHLNYDFIIGVTLGVIPAYFSGRPFVWLSTGSDLRQWINLKYKPTAFFLRRASKKAKAIFHIRGEAILDSIEKNSLQLKSEVIKIFPPQLFSCFGENDIGQENLIFSPTSHIWQNLPQGHFGKGNDIFLKGVALYKGRYKDFVLVLLDRGKDVGFSRKLIFELGLERHVIWEKEMNKKLLHKTMLNSCVVADQFVTGAGGTITAEAMALGRPVLIYVEDWFLERGMPVLNCRTPEDVCNALIKCRDEKFRREIGDKAKKWIEENASSEALGARLKKVIFESFAAQKTF